MELLVEKEYGPSLLAEFVLGPRLGKGCRHLIYTQCLTCATGKAYCFNQVRLLELE